MAPDPGTQAHLLTRLCQVARCAADSRVLFQQWAEALHDLTGCARVSLYPAPDGRPELPDLRLDFTAAPPRLEVPAAGDRPSAVEGVLERRQARLVPGGGQGWAALYLPLVCRGEAVGVLELATRQGEAPGRWDRELLEDVAGLLALALDGLAARARVADLQRFQRETAYLRDEIRTGHDLRLLTGESRAMKAVRRAVQQVAQTDSTVLILGETGTGKELVARAIHQLSPRRDRLLVSVNCAALAPGVIASELFGHEQGAFTGATRRRPGRFELAQHGTLFLDEVGELPAETQVMLLRVLQDRVVERVGGHEPIPVDVRIVAATHQDLEAAMSRQRFRADLFFRLNVFPIRVPPLRDRREDLPDLVRHFLHLFGRRLNRAVTGVSPATLRLLTEYPWPGNVRELENLIERAMIVSTTDTLEVDPSWLRPGGGADGAPRQGLAEMERRAILEALERCGGKVYGPGGAAAALGLKPTTLYGKMRKHRIERPPGAK